MLLELLCLSSDAYTKRVLKEKGQTEYDFLHDLWRKLERYGVEDKYKQNTKKLGIQLRSIK